MARFSEDDAPVRRPQMTQQQPDLLVRKLKDLLRQPLLVAALAMDLQLLEPFADAGRVPAIAVAADKKLMPLPSTGIPLHRGSHRLSGCLHRLAVRFGRSRITHRLAAQEAAITHELAKQRELRITPALP